MERYVRLFAGSFILLSLVLAHVHNGHWLWFTSFVGVNLIQSAVTQLCPLEIILRKLGMGGSCCETQPTAK